MKHSIIKVMSLFETCFIYDNNENQLLIIYRF